MKMGTGIIFSSSPYNPEPPRRSLLVEAFVRLSGRSRRPACRSPHLFGGSGADKVKWEYEQGGKSLDELAGYFSSGELAGKDVLDAGCGWGGKAIWYREHLSPRSVSGFDLPGVFDPSAAAAFAREKGVPNTFFTTGRAEAMPYEGARFDLVLMEDVLEHVDDPAEVLAECHRVLRPGGLLVARFPSIRMIYAHHLDRALNFPALHYILPFRMWVAGLNHMLLAGKGAAWEPFDEVVETRFGRKVTRNLNGMAWKDFRKIAAGSPFRTRALALVPFIPGTGGGFRPKRLLYRAMKRIPFLREPLSHFILFIGEKAPGGVDLGAREG